MTALSVSTLNSQAADEVRRDLALPVPPRVAEFAIAGLSAISPTGFGASWGDVYAGAGYQARARYVDANDGAVMAGFGLGNPSRLIGIQIDLISFSTRRSGFGANAGVDLKLHRQFPQGIAVAVGRESLLTRGEGEGSSSYVVGSVLRPIRERPEDPFSMVGFTLGVGDGRFLRERDWFEDRSAVNIFGSVALRVLEPVAIVADWTGQDLALAAAFIINWPLSFAITPGVADVTGQAGDGARFNLAVSVGHRFTMPF